MAGRDRPTGIAFDGSYMWVTNSGDSTVTELKTT